MKRILFLDVVRAIALFLVVFAHLYKVDSEVKLYIYAFHMPLFFFISGYLHKNSDYRPLFKKMMQRMLIPFCFFLFIGYLYNVISSKSLELGTAYESVIGIIFGQKIVANDILWFLLALFHVRIMGNIFIRNPKVAILPFLMISLICYVFHYNFLFLGSALMALPFYLAGYYGRDMINRVISHRYAPILSVILLLASVLITRYNGKVSMMGCIYGNTPSPLLNILLFYLNGIIGTMMIICIAQLVKKQHAWINAISYSSITIVGLQYIPIVWWYRNIGFNQPYIWSLLYSVLIVAACVGAHFLLEKKANWLIGNR